ncbi:hypothetical protein [Methanocella conradii]|uniref:hypothetical protein n=1 Tax=Methanocella conradii TaxID=1175444 RepID=UPI00157C49A1|nr:hypothetical protein [Methanocella conradii]
MKIRANPYGITDRINELIDNLHELEDAKNDGTPVVDLCHAEFIKPFSILPLAVYANYYGITITCTEPGHDIQSYLRTIKFQRGVTELKNVSDKTYLPIIRLPANQENSVLYDYEEHILSKVNAVQKLSGFNDGLRYLTGELESNIIQHSQADHYWLLAQYYDTHNKTCEIVIADTGIGYRESYRNTPYEVDTDKEAIINALEGKSSKHSKEKFKGMGEFIERGTGIPSIVSLCINGLGGKLVIMSGDTIVYYKSKQDRIIVPLKSYWKGSLIALNLNVKSVDYFKYIK